MTDIDATAGWLARVRAQLDELSRSLVDLDADPVTKLLEGSQFQGSTARAAEDAAAALTRLWALLPGMRQQLDEVEAEVAKGRRADSARLEHLLREPVVRMDPAAAGATAAGLGAVSAMTVTDAINQMVADHAVARGIVERIGGAWRDGLVLVDEARLQVGSFEAEVGSYPELAAAVALLSQADQAAALDPLALGALAAPLRDALESATAARAELVARRDGLPAELREAAELLARVDRTIRDGTVAFDEARSKVAAPAGLLQPLDAITLLDASPRGLGPWLERLRRNAAGDWRATINGLAVWRQLATDTLATAEAVLAANSAPLARRNELRGLLGAMAAKAAAAGYAEHVELSALRRRARSLLSVAPCDLVAAEAAVARFQEALRAMGPAPMVQRSGKDSG